MTQREKLIELLENAPAAPNGERNVATLADHLLENGIIVPPCRVGQTVYYIRGGYYRKVNLEVCQITVTEISKKEVKGKLQLAFIANSTRYSFGSIGKTVFLSREDAEKALAERSKE